MDAPLIRDTRSSRIFSYSSANSINHFLRSSLRSNFRIDVATPDTILVAWACIKKNRISYVFQGDLVVDVDDDDDDGIDIDNISIVEEYSTSAWIESPINDIGVFSICIIGSYGIFHNRSNSIVRFFDVL